MLPLLAFKTSVRHGESSEGPEFRRVAFLVSRTGVRRIKAGTLESGMRNQAGPSHFPCHLGIDVVLYCQTGEFGTDAPQFRRQALVVNHR